MLSTVASSPLPPLHPSRTCPSLPCSTTLSTDAYGKNGKAAWATLLASSSTARKEICPSGGGSDIAVGIPTATPIQITRRRLLAATPGAASTASGAASTPAAASPLDPLGPVLVVLDGMQAAMPSRKPQVLGLDNACDGSSVVITNQVPLPCDFLQLAGRPKTPKVSKSNATAVADKQAADGATQNAAGAAKSLAVTAAAAAGLVLTVLLL